MGAADGDAGRAVELDNKLLLMFDTPVKNHSGRDLSIPCLVLAQDYSLAVDKQSYGFCTACVKIQV